MFFGTTSTCTRVILWVVVLLPLISCAGQKTSPRERPNIVVIMVDDMGYSDIGSYGGEIDTPNLDRLAENGLRFTQFYNAARCCPTRASLLTGLYPHQAGIGRMVSAVESEPVPGPYQGFLNQRCVTIAEVLRSAGYRTYMSGKWHVGEKPEHWPRRAQVWELYDLDSDPTELNNLVDEFPERLRSMQSDWDSWAKRVGVADSRP